MLNPRRRQKPRNLEGGYARMPKAKEELALLSVSSVLQDSFYESADDTILRLHELVGRVDGEFVLKLAKFARIECNMRVVPAVLLASYTLYYGQPSDLSVFVRGDEVLDYLAAVKALSSKNKVTPSAVRFGRKVLHETLTERKAHRYAKTTRQWSLRKAIRLTHAMSGATPEQEALFRYVLNDWDSLTTSEKDLLPFTRKVHEGEVVAGWEQGRSAGASWNSLVSDMGYMALLRNLSNFVQDEDFTEWDYVLSRISDAEEVRNSKQFPFRFFSAMRALKGSWYHEKYQEIITALEKALSHSVIQVPRLPGKTVIIVDNSASMYAPLSRHSKVRYADVASLFGAVVGKNYGAKIITFGTVAKEVPILPGKSELDIAFNIRLTNTGQGTRLQTAFNLLTEPVDNVVIFSDMQFMDQVHFTANGAKVFSVNLAAYRPTIKADGDVYYIGGWSDTVVKLLPLFGDLVGVVDNYA